MALFIDNLTAHKTKKVMAKYKELQFATIFNVPYQPEFSAIEYVFSRAKHQYRQLKLEALAKGLNLPSSTLI